VNRIRKQFGFSLTEMLIATGIMAIGLVMVATIFPVGVKLTTLTTERAVGAVAADEAFAKIRLYGLRDFQFWPSALLHQADPAGFPDEYSTCSNYIDVNRYSLGPDRIYNTVDDIPVTADWEQFRYPSVLPTAYPEGQKYHWSALCRRAGDKAVQITVFVNRRNTAGNSYYGHLGFSGDASNPYPAANNLPWPSPVRVQVRLAGLRKLQVVPEDNPKWTNLLLGSSILDFFSDGYTIADDYSGRIYRILEVNRTDGILTLAEDWITDPAKPAGLAHYIWVVPPAAGSDRYPCVGVYQKVIQLDQIQ